MTKGVESCSNISSIYKYITILILPLIHATDIIMEVTGRPLLQPNLLSYCVSPWFLNVSIKPKSYFPIVFK